MFLRHLAVVSLFKLGHKLRILPQEVLSLLRIHLLQQVASVIIIIIIITVVVGSTGIIIVVSIVIVTIIIFVVIVLISRHTTHIGGSSGVNSFLNTLETRFHLLLTSS